MRRVYWVCNWLDCRENDMTTLSKDEVVRLAREAGYRADALSRNRIMAADSDGNYTREVTPRVITAAIAAGQQYLKENGK